MDEKHAIRVIRGAGQKIGAPQNEEEKIVAKKMAVAALSARKRPLRRFKPSPTISLAQMYRKEPDYYSQAIDDSPYLTERESLLVWAAARAAVSMGATTMVRKKEEMRVLNIMLITIAGTANGVPDIAVMEVKGEQHMTTIQQVRDHLQTQLQDLIDRHYLAVTKSRPPHQPQEPLAQPPHQPQQPQQLARPLITVLGLYEVDDADTCSSALLDDLTTFPSDLVATIAIH